MTLPVPGEMTAAVAQTLTATEWNSNVRDAVNFLLNPPLFVGYQATAQSIPSAAWTSVTIDTTIVDTYAGHSDTVNPSRYTAQVSGWYDLAGMVPFGTNSTGSRAAAFWVGGAASSTCPTTILNPTAGLSCEVPCWGVTYLTVGQYVELRGYQNFSGAIPLNVATGQTAAFRARWMHA